MPVSKKKKDHSKRLKNRNSKIEQEKNKVNKLRKEWLTQLINKEKERGAFNSTKPLDELENLEGPTI
jgi:hypothetical protein